MPTQFTDANFKEEVMESDKLSVVDFWAEWCGPCKMLNPIIEELSEEYNESVSIGKLNVDDNPQVSSNYDVRSIPTILFIKDGEVVDKQVGAASKQALKDKIEKHKN